MSQLCFICDLLCVFATEGRGGEDGHKLCSGLWSRHREDHQTFTAASLQHRGPGGRDTGVPGQSQDLPGRGGQESGELHLQGPAGLCSREWTL